MLVADSTGGSRTFAHTHTSSSHSTTSPWSPNPYLHCVSPHLPQIGTGRCAAPRLPPPGRMRPRGPHGGHQPGNARPTLDTPPPPPLLSPPPPTKTDGDGGDVAPEIALGAKNTHGAAGAVADGVAAAASEAVMPPHTGTTSNTTGGVRTGGAMDPPAAAGERTSRSRVAAALGASDGGSGCAADATAAAVAATSSIPPAPSAKPPAPSAKPPAPSACPPAAFPFPPPRSPHPPASTQRARRRGVPRKRLFPTGPKAPPGGRPHDGGPAPPLPTPTLAPAAADAAAAAAAGPKNSRRSSKAMR
ncbi:hypothetical protein BU14_0257s0017 [Porphyra umbilicalis]|uniref:Uncharacterized protein n=1 Tax=Porphyra umbilicalis TaxID=2786 RepID=A0A1X6P2J1_PORUM|nr:hypothetical protein BU14_0257s0017 [Porphyra umbilicalis]|eukprot:OSX75047.1 hypothetical protein BU14_0257s0017 [Porphyra umbilicalis]